MAALMDERQQLLAVLEQVRTRPRACWPGNAPKDVRPARKRSQQAFLLPADSLFKQERRALSINTSTTASTGWKSKLVRLPAVNAMWTCNHLCAQQAQRDAILRYLLFHANC